MGASLLVLAYLMGSIPTAVWVGKYFYSIDVRDYGSGNAGATNTFRVLGPRAGVPVLLMDVLKGYFAVKLVWLYPKLLPDTAQFINFELGLALCALLGHIFPIFAGFRGGKGVAILLGILCAIHWQAAGFCALVFASSLLLTRYVSLSSMLAALAFPTAIMFVYNETVKGLNLFSLFVCILILITHQKNIERLIRGKESKVPLFRSQRPDN